MWHPIATAPYDRDLQLAVIEHGETHALVFPCRRIFGGWVDAHTRRRVPLRPTHWCKWTEPEDTRDQEGRLRSE